MYNILPSLAETSISVYHKWRVVTSHKEQIVTCALSHVGRANRVAIASHEKNSACFLKDF